MSGQEKLSHCQFCGSQANIHRLGSFSSAIHCEACPASMAGEDRDTLVKAWNMRVKSPAA